MWGDEKWVKHQEETQVYRDQIDKEQWEQGTELENLLKKAEKDKETFQLVELARMLDGHAFKMREEGLERCRQMRLSAQGNDPSYQDIIRVHERVARLSIEYAISKARSVLWLIKSWE